VPPAVALIAGEIATAVYTAATSAGLSVTIATEVANVAFYAAQAGISLAVSVGLNALLRPKMPQPESGMTTFRQARPPRQRGYGRVRLGGPTALYDTYVHTGFEVAAIHDGEIDAFEQWFLSNDEIGIDAFESSQQFVVKQFPDGRYKKNHVVIAYRFGLTPETVYPGPNSSMPGQWGPNARGDGVASFLLSCTGAAASSQQSAFPFGFPNPSVVARLAKIWDWRDPGQSESDPSTWKWTANPIVAIADYLTGPIGGMGFDFGRRIAPVLDLWTTAADICDEQVQVVWWSTFLTIGSQGNDTASGSQPAVDFIVVNDATSISIGTVIEFGAENETVTGITSDPNGTKVTFTGDLSFTYRKGTYVQWQPTAPAFKNKYELGGFYTYDNDPADVLNTLLQTCDAWFSTDGHGHFVIYGGKYQAPDPVNDNVPSAAVMGYELKPFLEDELAVNTIMLAFSDPAHQWATTDTTPWLNETDIAERGLERSQDLKLTWVHNNSQAQRLAKRGMSRLSQPSGSLTMNLAGLAYLGRRYLTVNVEELDTLNGVVVEIKKVKMEIAALRVTYEFIVADPNIDAWNPAIEEGTGAGVGSTSTNTSLAAPVIASVTPDYVNSSGEGIGARLLVISSTPLGEGFDWIVQVSPTGTGQWVDYNFTDVAGDYQADLLTGFVPAFGTVDVRVAYSTGGGISPFSDIAHINVAAPSFSTLQATATENIAAGDFVQVVSTGTGNLCSRAIASASGKPADGFAQEAIANTASGTITLIGLNGAVTVAINAPLVWLSPTVPGGFVYSAPDAGTYIVQTLGSAISSIGILFHRGVPSGAGLPALGYLLTEDGGIRTSEDGTPLQTEG
jgi:hypothetical protein